MPEGSIPITRAMMSGPNAAPSAFQANRTRLNIVSGRTRASATDAMTIVVMTSRDTRSRLIPLAWPSRRSWASAADAASSSESTVDMTAESTAAMTMPASTGGSSFAARR